MKRRDFIAKSISAGVAAGIGLPLLSQQAKAVPLAETSKASISKMKIGLYSITYLGCWYKDRPLTWQEVLQRAKDFGYDGVEFGAKRPHANPMDWDQNTRKAVVDRAGELGLELPALAANNYGFLIKELARIGYCGYLNWEFCHCAIDKNGNPGTLKMIDAQTELALEYMRGLVADAYRQK